MTELLSCPFCGGEVGFHKDEDCNGCHYIWCHSCDGMFDLSAKADPENDTETLEELNERIAPIWNNRAQQSAPAGLIERDTLRKQLDEARELLAVASEIIHEQAIHIDRPMTDLGSEALTRLDDWLEANGK